MNNQTFSERHGFAPAPEPLPYDQVPPEVRSEVARTFQEFAADRGAQASLGDLLYNRLKPLFWKVIGPPPGTPWGGPWKYYILKLIHECQWWQFYDICEHMYKVVARPYGEPQAEIFAQVANAVFAREGVVWRFKEGRIERAYPLPIAQKIEEARALLMDPRFHGADQQFGKALGHMNTRPDPDKENCVKDAIGAVEAIARIVSANHKAILPDILGKEPFRSGIHPALRVAIEKLYAYRGDVGGAAHGQVGPSEVGVEEAEWILMMAAGTILYLANKFGEPTK